MTHHQQKISFYFDFLSPFSYFAWLKMLDFEQRNSTVEFIYKPVALGPILNHWGIKGPGEVQPKREFLLKQMLRYSKKNHIDFTTPKSHPFNSIYALRLALKIVSKDEQKKVINTLWKAGWQDRIDLGSPDEIINALRKHSLPADELYEASFLPEAKKELKNNIKEAIEKKVFGVPSFVIEDELFWGVDSFEDLDNFINHKDPLDRDKFYHLLNSTPRAASQSLS